MASSRSGAGSLCAAATAADSEASAVSRFGIAKFDQADPPEPAAESGETPGDSAATAGAAGGVVNASTGAGVIGPSAGFSAEAASGGSPEVSAGVP
ncbi:hypothetical protein [Catenuloplanes atrovinosus]|uniref:Uncharacterized protein n=1 Tax=Catenuloplanes atrovinosus TaxID=137266 RepID=A0AAE3YTS1_9ACTN|nr:hypothetical protein [Catenuloplanes atrovinosus]MDR7279739.1 hypothetical protein [Catenuloplanes atrovinosus]